MTNLTSFLTHLLWGTVGHVVINTSNQGCFFKEGDVCVVTFQEHTVMKIRRVINIKIDRKGPSWLSLSVRREWLLSSEISSITCNQLLFAFQWCIGISDRMEKFQNESMKQRRKHNQKMGCAVVVVIYMATALSINQNNVLPDYMDPPQKKWKQYDKAFVIYPRTQCIIM